MQPAAHLVTVIRHAVCVGRTPEIIRPKVRVAHLDEVLLLHLPLISEDVVDRPPGIRVDLHGLPLLVREHRFATSVVPLGNFDTSLLRVDLDVNSVTFVWKRVVP